MSKKLKPVHPGEVLREEFLVPAGMSVNQLALALRISTPRLNQIVRGISAVTPNTALRLARYLNTTPDFWLSLQLQYDLDIAEDREGPAIEREVFRANPQASNPQNLILLPALGVRGRATECLHLQGKSHQCVAFRRSQDLSP